MILSRLGAHSATEITITFCALLTLATGCSLGQELDDSYIRYETLTQSNDKLSNDIATLPIFSYYHVDDNQLFSSIDGQKFE